MSVDANENGFKTSVGHSPPTALRPHRGNRHSDDKHDVRYAVNEPVVGGPAGRSVAARPQYRVVDQKFDRHVQHDRDVQLVTSEPVVGSQQDVGQLLQDLGSAISAYGSNGPSTTDNSLPGILSRSDSINQLV